MKLGTTSKLALVKALIAVAVAIAAIAFLFWYTGHRRPTITEKQVIFDQSVAPIIAQNASANAAALETLKLGIHSLYDQYRHRVPTFTEDIMGLGNKSQIVWNSFRDMTSPGPDRAKRHVAEKFALHVASVEAMQRDLEGLAHAFKRDIEANRNLMLSDIEAAVSNHPEFGVDGLRLPDGFAKELQCNIDALSKQVGKDAIVIIGLDFVVSAAADRAVPFVVKAALTRVCTRVVATMATSAATAAGTTAAGGAAGGAVGTSGGPVGIAAGVAIGLAVCIVVDLAMSERHQSTLNGECCGLLTKIEAGLTEQPQGLVASAAAGLAELERVQSPIIKRQLDILP